MQGWILVFVSLQRMKSDEADKCKHKCLKYCSMGKRRNVMHGLKEIMRLVLVLLIVSFSMVSCEKEGNFPGSSTTERTVFMYLPWASNLAPYFKDNIADMERVVAKNILNNERVLVFFSSTSTEATLFELKYDKGKCVRSVLKSYVKPAFTTSAGITSILEDVKTFAPANNYAMIIGCHGLGWVPVSTSKSRIMSAKKHWEYEGVPQTRYFGGLTSEYQTDITTLAEGITDAGIKMEYILFDDCYMSSVEVAYDLKEVADHIIASTCEIMVYGMPYSQMGKSLFGKVDYQGICNAFLAFYEDYEIMPCGTISMTVCSELEGLAAVMKEINGRYTFDTSLLSAVQRLDGYTPVVFYDYGDYVAKLCPDADLSAAFEAQLERAVPSKCRKHTDYFYTMSRGKIKINAYSGITVSDPSTHSWAVSKTETAWYKATH